MSEEDLTTTEDAFDLDLAEADGGSPAGQFEDSRGSSPHLLGLSWALILVHNDRQQVLL